MGPARAAHKARLPGPYESGQQGYAFAIQGQALLSFVVAYATKCKQRWWQNSESARMWFFYFVHKNIFHPRAP